MKISYLLTLMLLLMVSGHLSAFAEHPRTADFYMKGKQECLSCQVIDANTSIILNKYSMSRLYSKWMRRGIAGGTTLVLQKPDGTHFKLSMNQILREKMTPEQHQHLFNVLGQGGYGYKDLHKELVDYPNEYIVFSTQAGEKITLPFRSIDMIANASTGELLYNGVVWREKIGEYQQMNTAVAFGLMARQQAQRQQVTNTNNNSWIPLPQIPAPPAAPQRVNINCNTMGNFTNCSGW